MRCTFAYGLKETVAALVLSCFIAGGVGAMTSPAVSESNDPIMTLINRTHKGARLPQASMPYPQPNDPEIVPASPKRAPLGCDPAFSSVADPARAHIFMRCMA